MSPRAAWRLESLGFQEVSDYVTGKIDWLATGLPSEGPDADQLRAGAFIQPDVLTCRLDERVGAIRERVRTAGWDSCLVLNDARVVLGRLRGQAFEGDPNRLAASVMEPGPTTVRPNEPLANLVERMRGRNVTSIIVTTSEGRLMGILVRADAERRLAAPPHAL